MSARGTSSAGRARRARPWPAAAVLAATLALGGCVTEQREVAIGNQIATQINGQVPLVQDVPLNLYVNDLGRLIASHSERPALQYHFYIVDSPALNAFALPGGHVYVNRGLIERTQNISELAGILAHEIGHVAARHGAENLQRQMRTRSMSRTMYQLILGREPMLDQEALDLGGALWQAQNSRADEQEADRLAVDYLVRSGVDPRGMLSLFSTLWQEEQHIPGSAQVSWFSTHPGTAARMQATRQQIRALPAVHKPLATNNESYAAFLRRLSEQPPPMGIVLPPGHPRGQ
ncbi:M48 family metallopeptidase [Longimicrobium sp.]|uniref:M48 family metallopeptidase n=1 Tax=Longimicrobium sp. TaxID=2029185 RepID=UPI002E36FE25|nr:M48 family metallopeptidase [Longimicrobium sp.]HEX6038156.1 M48 family metallopeptidase [Longimicrobium sp.]